MPLPTVPLTIPSPSTLWTGGKRSLDKVWQLADKKLVSPVVNGRRLSLSGARVGGGREAFGAGRLDEECDKAARILRSFCKDGFYEEDDSNTPGSPAPIALGRAGSTEKDREKVLRKIPQSVISNALALLIFTTVRSGFSSHHPGPDVNGSGVLIARLPDGTWSAPSAVFLQTPTAGSGFFVGGVEVYDGVFVVNSPGALEAFSQPRCTLGAEGELRAVPGPVDGMVESAGVLGWDILRAGVTQAPVFAYLKSRGVFYPRAQVEGTVVVERTEENERVYGVGVAGREVLGGGMREALASVREGDGVARLRETVRFALGEADVDLHLIPSDPTPGDSAAAAVTAPPTPATPTFGIPDEADPDPFGVKALEMQGLLVVEAGTRARPAKEVFEFRPSPRSPVRFAPGRRSQDWPVPVPAVGTRSPLIGGGEGGGGSPTSMSMSSGWGRPRSEGFRPRELLRRATGVAKGGKVVGRGGHGRSVSVDQGTQTEPEPEAEAGVEEGVIELPGGGEFRAEQELGLGLEQGREVRVRGGEGEGERAWSFARASPYGHAHAHAHAEEEEHELEQEQGRERHPFAHASPYTHAHGHAHVHAEEGGEGGHHHPRPHQRERKPFQTPDEHDEHEDFDPDELEEEEEPIIYSDVAVVSSPAVHQVHLQQAQGGVRMKAMPVSTAGARLVTIPRRMPPPPLPPRAPGRRAVPPIPVDAGSVASVSVSDLGAGGFTPASGVASSPAFCEVGLEDGEAGLGHGVGVGGRKLSVASSSVLSRTPGEESVYSDGVADHTVNPEMKAKAGGGGDYFGAGAGKSGGVNVGLGLQLEAGGDTFHSAPASPVEVERTPDAEAEAEREVEGRKHTVRVGESP